MSDHGRPLAVVSTGTRRARLATFEPADGGHPASSSRSHLRARRAWPKGRPTCDGPSASVRTCRCMAAALVTQLVARGAVQDCSGGHVAGTSRSFKIALRRLRSTLRHRRLAERASRLPPGHSEPAQPKISRVTRQDAPRHEPRRCRPGESRTPSPSPAAWPASPRGL